MGSFRIVFCILVISLLSVVSAQGLGCMGESSYSIVHISDTQTLSSQYPSTLNFTFSFLESIQSQYNISAIIVTGDLVDTRMEIIQWVRYSDARSLTAIPLYEVSGNHDISGSLYNYTQFDAFIGSGKRNWTAEINDLLFIGIGYTRNALDETDVSYYTALIESNPSKIPVFATHNYFDGITSPPPVSPLAASIRRELVVRNPTLIMCGHVHGNILQISDSGGNTLIEDMTNYQGANYSAGRLYTVYKFCDVVTRITTRNVYIFPVQSYSPEVTVYLSPEEVNDTEIGIFRPSTHTFYLDWNGNGRWDGVETDRAYDFGLSADVPVSGDWGGYGTTEIGVFRNSTHTFYLDYNGNGRWDGHEADRAYDFGLVGDSPVSGDWDHDGITEIGVFRLTTHTFYLDYNGNGRWDGVVTDRAYDFGLSGDTPATGDWGGYGSTEIGVFRPTTHMFYLDYNGNGRWDGVVTDRAYDFGLAGDLPLSSDWGGFGTTEIGVFRPGTHTFYLDYSGNGKWDGVVIDRAYNFGLTSDWPVTGEWA